MPGNLTAVLTSWPLLLSLAALIGNDLYLKYAFPGLITGKLSDFAGIFLVTVLAFALLPRRRLLSTLLIVLLFAWWKSPLSQPVIDAINAIAPVRFARVVDYWDLLAFSMIPVALVVARRNSGETPSRYRRFAAFPVAAVALVATTGTSVIVPTKTFRVQDENVDSGMRGAEIAAIVERVAGNYGAECEHGGEGDVYAIDCVSPDLWLMGVVHEPSGTAQFLLQNERTPGMFSKEPDAGLLDRVMLDLRNGFSRASTTLEFILPPEEDPYGQLGEFWQMICDEDPECESE